MILQNNPFFLSFSATPKFWLGLIIIWVLTFKFGWIPYGNIYFQAIIIILMLTITQFGSEQLFMRSRIISTLGDIAVAESKASGNDKIRNKHTTLKRMLPMVKSLGIKYSVMVGALTVLEPALGYKGIGQIMLQSVTSRDFPTLQGCFLFITTSVIVISLLGDILYKLLERRIQPLMITTTTKESVRLLP